MQQALTHVYKDQELAVAALKTVYFMAKNLPNDHFSDLKHVLVLRAVQILLTSVFSVVVEDDSLPTSIVRV